MIGDIYVAVDEHGIVSMYGIVLDDNHIPITDGILIDTDLDLDETYIVGEYRLDKDKLISVKEDNGGVE